jgi:hypothetical protein
MHHLHRQLFLLQTLQHLSLLEETRTTPEMTVMTTRMIMMMVMMLRMRVMVKTLREMGRATMIRVTAPTTTATHLVASRAMVLV